jgi:hypothetical protein
VCGRVVATVTVPTRWPAPGSRWPARGLPAGLVLTPSTTDPGVARSWLGGHGGSGIEGVVAKRLDQPYRPGIRGW